ncbi:MAG: hypothetical protein EP334_10105 [Gammaproteobacteria bacterium]|nr:MAG: hypothetical protein EP334_10105 [Gammaproteobacteria bacterium]
MADTKTSGLSSITGANTATGDKFPVLDVSDTTQGAGGTLKTITRAELKAAMEEEGLGAASIIHVQDQKTSGTSGGSASATTQHTRTLNTVIENGITGASLSSNQITLPAGTYRSRAAAAFWGVDRNKLRLRDVTNSVTLVVGLDAYQPSTAGGNALLRGKFTLSGTAAIELQHYTAAAKATAGLGIETNNGDIEVYADVYIEKIA